jgi:hypothetical protein
VIVRGRDCRGSNDRHRKSSGRFERFITAHKTNKPTKQQNKQTTKHKKQTTMRFTLSALLIVSASATSMLPDARCGALTQCYLVNLATSGRNNVFNPVGTPVGATVTAYDPTAAGNDGYSIYCDTERSITSSTCTAATGPTRITRPLGGPTETETMNSAVESTLGNCWHTVD